MSVIWQTNSTGTNMLTWGKSPTEISDSAMVDEYGNYHMNKYEISELEP